jgi:hypothetical protein
MPIVLPPIRATEPKAPVALIKAGHPYLGFAYGLLWQVVSLLGPLAAVVLVLFLA